MQDYCSRYDPVILQILGAWLLLELTRIIADVWPMQEPTRDPEQYPEFIGDD